MPFRHAAAPLLAIALPVMAQQPVEERSAPNVVVVFIDDMGYADLSCFGNADSKTPEIDRLAAEGLAFEQFYVNSPICSPSRVALTTGQYPMRHRITSYLDNRKANERRGLAQWLDPEVTTLADILKGAGYRTGHFGKWHMGGQRDVDDAPPITAYGFDASLTNFEGMGPKLLPLTRAPGDAEPKRIWAAAERLGGPFRWVDRAALTGGFVDAALAFIDEAQREDRPFYVNVWPDDVHTPLWPPLDDWAEGKRARYLAVLRNMDRQLGPLFARIRDDESLRDNTLILVCSDNGHEPGAGSAGSLRGSKTNLYEGGIRSPLVVWGPGLLGGTTPGTRDATSVFAAIDIPPTLLALAEIEAPEGTTFDGEALPEVLTGTSPRSRAAPLFFRRPPDRKQHDGLTDLPDLAVRQGRFKLLCDFDGSRPELYDLEVDPKESANLAASQSERTRRMVEELLAWNASMPEDRGPELGATGSRR
ncbi:MAG: sulfatase-like hydrolase/transferase [Planctomycetota bacterium]